MLRYQWENTFRWLRPPFNLLKQAIGLALVSECEAYHAFLAIIQQAPPPATGLCAYISSKCVKV